MIIVIKPDENLRLFFMTRGKDPLSKVCTVCWMCVTDCKRLMYYSKPVLLCVEVSRDLLIMENMATSSIQCRYAAAFCGR